MNNKAIMKEFVKSVLIDKKLHDVVVEMTENHLKMQEMGINTEENMNEEWEKIKEAAVMNFEKRVSAEIALQKKGLMRYEMN